jgi:hypothetical protein
MAGKSIEEILNQTGPEDIGRIREFHPEEMNIAVVEQILFGHGRPPELRTHITETSKCGFDPKKRVLPSNRHAVLNNGDWLSLTIRGTSTDADGIERSYAIGEYRIQIPEVTQALDRLYSKMIATE